MRHTAIGTVILMIIGLIAFINQDWNLFIEVAAVVGMAGLLLAAVFSGSLGSGDRMRANYTHEEEDDRIRRRDWVNKLVLISLPNILGAVIGYFIV